MKKILFLVSRTVVAECGGIERATTVLAEIFRSHGHEIWTLAWENSGENPSVPVEYFPVPAPIDSPKNAEFFEQFLRSRGIDFVIFQWGVGRKFPFPQVTHKLGVPAVAVLHSPPDYYQNRYGFFERIRRKFSQSAKYRWNFEHCDATILLSESQRVAFENHLTREQKSRSHEKVFAIENPIVFAAGTPISLAEKRKEILFVGRLENKSKRVNLLLEIWAKIAKDFPDWQLKIVGDGNDRTELETLAGTLNLRERVEFCGFQNPAEFYRHASIFCMTSAYEGFPLVLIEAANFACVPVAFDSFAAVHDVISDGENGAIVGAFDLEKYAQTLAKLMRERDWRERLATNAQRDVARFSPEKIYEKWEELFKKFHTDLFESNDSHGNENSTRKEAKFLTSPSEFSASEYHLPKTNTKNSEVKNFASLKKS